MAMISLMLLISQYDLFINFFIFNATLASYICYIERFLLSWSALLFSFVPLMRKDFELYIVNTQAKLYERNSILYRNNTPLTVVIQSN